MHVCMCMIVCMCMYVRMYLRMHVCSMTMYVHVRMYVCMHGRTYECTSICVCMLKYKIYIIQSDITLYFIKLDYNSSDKFRPYF